jgi:hypothetical protein
MESSNNTIMSTLDHIAKLEMVRSEIMEALAEKWQTVLDYIKSPPHFDTVVDILNDSPIEPPPAKRIRLSPELANAPEFEPPHVMNEYDELRCIGSLLKNE